MQGNRHQRIGLGQKFPAGLADPAPHHRREVEPIATFKGMHQSPRNFVEAYRGAGAMVGRRVGDRFHGQDARTRVIDERNAEPLAIGPGDEREFRPARRTEPFTFDRLAASRAQPRQGEIERGAQQRAHGAAGALESRRAATPASSPNTSPMPPRYRSIMDLS